MAYDCYFLTHDLSREQVSKFKSIRNKIPNVRMVKIQNSTDIETAVNKIKNISNTEYYWVIDPNTDVDEDFDWKFVPDIWDKNLTHVWNSDEKNQYHMTTGVKLFHRTYDFKNFDETVYYLKGEYKTHGDKYITTVKREKLYDVIFLSYREETADENYQKLLQKVPYAKRVHGVEGIFNAHKAAANIAETEMFYVVDADAEIVDDFEFNFYAEPWDSETVHTWRSQNPINDLVYGYGGVKLFPTQLLRDAEHWNIDFTTSVSASFKLMDEVSNKTAFATDPFSTWKSAFRECVKLSTNIIDRSISDENQERLNIWCTVGQDRAFGEYSILGATQGRKYGEENIHDQGKLNMINDFEWLKKKFGEKNE
jgi:hypothetical protein